MTSSKIGTCPYYSLNEATEFAEIVLMTYNHLFTSKQTLKFDFKDQIIVIDEAHNIEESILSVFSCDLPKSFLIELKAAIEKYLIANKARLGYRNLVNITKTQNFIEKLLKMYSETAEILDSNIFLVKFRLDSDFSIAECLSELAESNFFEKLKGYGNLDSVNVYELKDFADRIFTASNEECFISINFQTLTFFKSKYDEDLSSLVKLAKMVILAAGTLNPLDSLTSNLSLEYNADVLELGIFSEYALFALQRA